MNRRRKFGSTILLSSLAALAVVGTGLAVASWLPAEGESQFGIHFNDNTSKVIGEVTTTTKDARFDITWDSASGTAGFDKDIVLQFTPDESLDLTGKELELSWTATFPEGFDTYFDVTTSGVLSPDATTRATTYSFTLEKDALKASLKDGQDYAAAHEAIGDEAQLTLSYKVDLKETAEPEPVVESVTLDAESLSFKVGDEAKTLKATVKMTTGDAPAIAWTFSEGYETYIDVTGEDTDTLSITPKAAGEVTITATAGGKSDSAKVTITEESVEDPFASATEVSVSEYLDAVAEDASETKLYKLTGVVGEIYNTEYGNGTLYDAVTGESLMLFGLTATESALTGSAGEFTFKNPKDFSSTVSSLIEEGDEIVMYGLYKVFNGTPEIMGVFDSVTRDKTEITYSVTKDEAIQNGSITLSAESGVYGTEIEVTTTPAEGYRAQSVSVNGKEVVVKDNQATIKVVPGPNVVSAKFVEDTPITEAVKYDLAAAASGFGTSYSARKFLIEGVAFAVTADEVYSGSNNAGAAKNKRDGWGTGNLLIMGKGKVNLDITATQSFRTFSYHGFRWGH